MQQSSDLSNASIVTKMGDPGHVCFTSGSDRMADIAWRQLWGDCVAKVESCGAQIFGENLKRKEVNDSLGLSRATEVAHEFGARR